jgi:uracil-DNA glycosylase family 4
LKPFFNLLDTPIERGDELAIHKKQHDCASCGRAASCALPKAPEIGQGTIPILFVGPAITRIEDKTEDSEHGTFHTLLKRYVRKSGNKLTDCWYTHAIKCYSKDKKAKPKTIESCHHMLMAQIKRLKPKVIVPTCSEAWDILLYDRKRGRASHASFSDYAGETIPDQIFGAWVMPIFDVGMVEKYAKKQNKYEPFATVHMKRIFEYVDIPVPAYNYDGFSKETTSKEKAMGWIDEALNWKVVALDYETSGIKPYRKGHFIACMSISNGEVSYAFPNFDDPAFKSKWKELLLSPQIKVAHNASFERTWSKAIFGVDIKNLKHCTMIGQHCFNNRRRTGEKYCAYAYFGIMGYETHGELLESTPEEQKKHGGNGFNRIKEFPLKDLLHYCAIDSLICCWLYFSLIKQGLSDSQLEGYKFFMEGMAALDKTHENGMCIDLSMVEKQKKDITQRMVKPYKEVISHNLITHQWDLGEAFNPKSDMHVRHLLFGILRLPPQGLTDSGLPSVDEEALSYLLNKCDLISPLLEFRKWNKALSTYIGQIERETVDGILRPFFGLHNVATYRSNSNSPNFQNQPKRDKEVMSSIRSCFIPRKGHKLIEYDYKACEVSIAAAVSGDPELIRYVSDPTSDMHKDASVSMYFLEPERVNKTLRNVT